MDSTFQDLKKKSIFLGLFAQSCLELVFDRLLYCACRGSVSNGKKDDNNDNNDWNIHINNEVIQFYEDLMTHFKQGEDKIIQNVATFVSKDSLLHNQESMEALFHNMLSINRKVFDLTSLHDLGNNLSPMEQSQVLLRTSVTTPRIGISSGSSSSSSGSSSSGGGRNINRARKGSNSVLSSSLPSLPSSSSFLSSSTLSPSSFSHNRNSGIDNNNYENVNGYGNSAHYNSHTSFTPMVHPYARIFESTCKRFNVQFFLNNFGTCLFEAMGEWTCDNAFKLLIQLAKIVTKYGRNVDKIECSTSVTNNFLNFAKLQDREHYDPYVECIMKALVENNINNTNSNKDSNHDIEKSLFTSMFVLFSIMYVTDNSTRHFVKNYGTFRLKKMEHANEPQIVWRHEINKDHRMLDTIMLFSLEMYLGMDFLPKVNKTDDRLKIAETGLYAATNIRGYIKEYFCDDIMRPDHALAYCNRQDLFAYLENYYGNTHDSMDENFHYYGNTIINGDNDYFKFLNIAWFIKNQSPISALKHVLRMKEEDIARRGGGGGEERENVINNFSIMLSQSTKWQAKTLQGNNSNSNSNNHEMYDKTMNDLVVPNYWKKEESKLCINLF
jgi:hypothetical protein